MPAHAGRNRSWLLLGLILLAVLAGALTLWRKVDRWAADLAAGLPLLADEPAEGPAASDAPAAEPAVTANDDEPDRYVEARRRMVERDLRGRDIDDGKVLEVMGRIPRHRFVPERLRGAAYADHPLPIGHDQTISQPYIVALMTQLARPTKKSRALDIGTGSGYQAAVLGEICKEVFSIEIVEPLAADAKERLAKLGYENVTVRHGDGYRGWKEHAPFDVIIVAAAPDHVPQPLVDQLAPGGRLVLPVGDFWQELVVIEKDDRGKVHRKPGIPVRFVPMTGEARKRER